MDKTTDKTSKLGADMTDDEIMHVVSYSTVGSNAIAPTEWCAFARALLARQPAAIGNEADDDIEEAREILENMVRSIELDGNYSTEATCTFLRQALNCLPVAAPLANEASKPAPSVEQDERVAFEAAWSKVYDTGDFLLRHYSITEQYVNHDTQRAWEGWKLRAASTSANVAQGAKPITDLATIVKAAYGNKAWISRRDDIPNFLSPTSADYADLKAEGGKTSSWHPDFVVAMYENSRPDKLYTMDQMREYADAFHRSRLDAALTAAQSASGDTK